MEFYFISVGITNTHDYSRNILFATIISPRWADLQKKSIKKSSSSNAIRLRNKLEGALVKYKRSKYLWDDIPLLIQTAYRKHEVATDRSGKDPFFTPKYFVEIDFILFYSKHKHSFHWNLKIDRFDQRLDKKKLWWNVQRNKNNRCVLFTNYFNICQTYLTVTSAFPEPKQKRDILPGDPRYGIDHHLDNVVQVKTFNEGSVVQDVYGPPGYQPGAPLGNEYLSPLAITEYSTPVTGMKIIKEKLFHKDSTEKIIEYYVSSGCRSG